MHKVITAFKDSEDKGHLYNVGVNYPRKDSKPNKARVEHLESLNLIKEEKKQVKKVKKED